MKLSNKRLGAMVGAALGLGVAGQASADVYGLSTIQVNNLSVIFTAALQSPPAFTFDTDQNAVLAGNPDGSDGSAECGGLFGLGNDCDVAPRLSGLVQNAPGSTSIRGENDYQVFGSAGNYSNAEAAIVTAVLAGDASTSTKAISESNISSAISAQAGTSVGSNTLLNLTFAVTQGGGGFSIAFDALINIVTQATGADIGAALAQANGTVTVVLQKAGETLASWVPSGLNSVTTCGVGLTCVATEASTALNGSRSSSGAPNTLIGGGHYSLDVTGLTTGQYTLALATTTGTNLRRFPEEVPVPGTLLLMGAGLLAGARALRRNK